MRRAQRVFYFKHFSIQHDRCAHKVGTDSVLLGAWLNCLGAKSVLEIGSGSGILSLMIAQRCDAAIDGVEIDEESVSQSRQNIRHSPWPNRINIFHQKIQQFHPGCRYDLIVTNPPYFVGSLQSPDARRSDTRHTQALTFEDLVLNTSRLLKEDGTFYLVLPPPEFELLQSIAADQGLFPFQKLLFRSKAFKPIERVLAGFNRQHLACEQQELTLYDEHDTWSESYRQLTREFHPHI